MSAPAVLTLLTTADCSLCEHAKQVVRRIQQDEPLTLEEVHLDSEQGRALAEEHDVLFAPGILLNGTAFGHGRLSERKLRRALARHP